MKKCSLCSKLVKDLDSLSITPVQARALSTTLTFDTAEVSVGLESKYVHTTPCTLCHQWVMEAETVILEWEQTIDKIRNIGSTLKRIIESSNLDGFTTNEPEDEALHIGTRTDDHTYVQLDDHDVHGSVPVPVSCVQTKLDVDEDDPEWLPDEHDTNELENLESHKDDEDESCCYAMEINGDTVTLKHCQVTLLPCDHPTFKYGPSKSKRFRESRSSSPSVTSRRENVSTVLAKLKQSRVGRPSKIWEPPERDPQNCFEPGCQFVSGDRDRLAGHYREVHLNDPRPYKCLELGCVKEYSNFRRFAIHRGIHRGQFPYKCQLCLKGFTGTDRLAHHVILKHTENPQLYSCDLCVRKYRLKAQLRGHMQSTHWNTTVMCTVEGCEFETKWSSTLRSHQGRQHPEQFPELRSDHPMCAECGATFHSKPAFQRHQLYVHSGIPGIVPVKPFKCSYVDCKFQSVYKPSLQKHIKGVHETTGKTVICTVIGCPTKFKSTTGLASHLDRAHSSKPKPVRVNKPTPCNHCGRKYVSKTGLQIHINIKHAEVNQRAHVCPRCQKGFPVKPYLDRHLLHFPNCKPVKIGPKSVFCNLCEKHCSNLTGLKRHQLLVHNTADNRPWKCEPCGKSFPIKMYLTRHQHSSTKCGSVPSTLSESVESEQKVTKSAKKSVPIAFTVSASEKTVEVPNPQQFESRTEQDFYYGMSRCAPGVGADVGDGDD